jgi:pseudouridine kinase
MEEKRIFVVGGINMDIHVAAVDGVFQKGTSNPSSVGLTPGGVARNIAENLARLGIAVSIAGVVGDDAFGETLVHSLQVVGVNTSLVKTLPGRQTGTYVTLIGSQGKVHTAASDMRIMDDLSADWIAELTPHIAASSLVVADTNLPEEALAALVDTCNHADVPVLVDPVSVHKASRLRAVTGQIDVLAPNADEWRTIESKVGLTPTHCLVTLGAEGVSWTESEIGRTVRIPARDAVSVDTTGAGDGFASGVAAALARNRPMKDAVEFGVWIASAVIGSRQCTIGSEDADNLRRMIEEE